MTRRHGGFAGRAEQARKSWRQLALAGVVALAIPVSSYLGPVLADALAAGSSELDSGSGDFSAATDHTATGGEHTIVTTSTVAFGSACGEGEHTYLAARYASGIASVCASEANGPVHFVVNDQQWGDLRFDDIVTWDGSVLDAVAPSDADAAQLRVAERDVTIAFPSGPVTTPITDIWISPQFGGLVLDDVPPVLGLAMPGPDAAEQAAYLYAVMTASAVARGPLSAHVAAARTCAVEPKEFLAAALAAVGTRQQQLIALSTAPVGALDADALISSLRAAWEASLAADESYLLWADSMAQDGCVAGEDERRADEYSRQAATPKRDAADLWSSFANEFGLPTVEAGDL